MKNVMKLVLMLSAASIFGVMTATCVTCGIGLSIGVDTWCGFGLIWLFAFPIALFFGVFFGVPGALLFSKFKLVKWWQFLLGGLLIASPFSFFEVRWQYSPYFDSLNYFGSGMFAGLWFWFFNLKLSKLLRNQD